MRTKVKGLKVKTQVTAGESEPGFRWNHNETLLSERA